SSAAVVVCGPASAATAPRRRGNWAAANAATSGRRNGPTSRPYAHHVPARTAAATAAYAVPSTVVSAASCSAYASRTVSARPRPVTVPAVERSPSVGRNTGAAGADRVTVAERKD